MPVENMAIATFVTILGGTGLLLGALWPFLLRDLVFIHHGLGRGKIQPLSDFPYQCRRVTGLQACEDMWLSEKSRRLFLACSGSLGRREWVPNTLRLNVSGRHLHDRIVALDIDQPVGVGFESRVLETPKIPSLGELHLIGMTGVDWDDYVELYVINNKPSVDVSTGELLDQEAVGANSTVELFRVNHDSQEVQHIKTFSDPQITTPNNIAPIGKGSFYFTNDHGPHKTGTRHHLSPILKDGDISYCNEGGCRKVDSGIGFPNGLAFGKDGLLYVPSSFSGNLRVYRTVPDGGIKQVDTVPIPYPLDNLSLDGNGDLWIPGIPDLKLMLSSFDDPLGPSPPTTALRIHTKANGDYEVEKILEDAKGEVLPAATAVVHDAKTGRIFLSGIFSPFISVCEPKDGAVAGGSNKYDSGVHEEL